MFVGFQKTGTLLKTLAQFTMSSVQLLTVPLDLKRTCHDYFVDSSNQGSILPPLCSFLYYLGPLRSMAAFHG